MQCGKLSEFKSHFVLFFLESLSVYFSSVQLLSHVRLFVTPQTVAPQASLSITKSQSLLKLMSLESAMPSNHIILCCPLLLLPSIFPSIRVFQMSQLFTSGGQRLEFQLQYQSSNEYSGLIFRMDRLDLLAVQGTLKGLHQHHNSKASILWQSSLSLWKVKSLSHVRLFATP